MNENIPFSSFYQLETVLHKTLWIIDTELTVYEY